MEREVGAEDAGCSACRCRVWDSIDTACADVVHTNGCMLSVASGKGWFVFVEVVVRISPSPSAHTTAHMWLHDCSHVDRVRREFEPNPGSRVTSAALFRELNLSSVGPPVSDGTMPLCSFPTSSDGHRVWQTMASERSSGTVRSDVHIV